ncbi:MULTISPECIES: PA3371 family protein [Pseudomonadaceae]|jgi:ABC-type multidrug transport system permease subunit|uniref:Uncharacterized protein n=1 Tax=Stutzerimonas stutzeri TaxID=316 RepID=A0A0D9ANJ1_STUST|nr:hypothetical protein UF78_06850 [Stutzerimonas stutzeri]
MSVYGCLFLLLGVACGVLSIGASLPGLWDTLVDCGTVLFGTLFVISLALGRRIKFDPVLR